jgi:predicted RNA-binding protein (virulence factor B family)
VYEVPKMPVNIVLNLDNDESITGTLWLTENLVSAMGNPMIEDFLNKERQVFFSFESDAGAFRLINKNHITFIETTQTDEEARLATPHKPHSMVLHFNNEQTLYGEVFPTMIEESRVSDLLNQNRQFQVLYRQGTKFIYNRESIVYANAN